MAAPDGGEGTLNVPGAGRGGTGGVRELGGGGGGLLRPEDGTAPTTPADNFLVGVKPMPLGITPLPAAAERRLEFDNIKQATVLNE